MCCFVFFFFKQKTAYEMRISDWSSDVCSSDLLASGRAELLELLFPAVQITRHDGASIDDRLDAAFVPDVVLMNPPFSATAHVDRRSEERRVGKECVSTCRSRWAPYH